MTADNNVARSGDLALLVAQDRKQFILRLSAGDEFQTHHGIVAHDDLIGRDWGEQIPSHLGHPFALLQPSLRDLLLLIKRRSQILFPKDIGYILLRLSVAPGDTVLESGTGSGALTTALAWTVGEQGQVISVDRRADMIRLAQENLALASLDQRVQWIQSDIADVSLDAPTDALFLDLPDPQAVLEASLGNLRPGGRFGALLPTANQVSELLSAMERLSFIDVDVCEIMLRFYKTVPARLRPADRMVAHTGYLVFGRPLAGT